MANLSNDYVKYVLDDIKKYDDIRKVVKAGLIERCATKFCPPEKIHPNPADEFSQAEVGPNMGIVSEYVDKVRFLEAHVLQVFEEPLIVQKMEPDGYVLLNGHHRWFAALRMKVKKIRIQIVNMISEADLNRMMKETEHVKLVTFDFDEVLLSMDENDEEKLESLLFARKYKERLKNGVIKVIKSFQENGYDVCVYTSGYLTEDDFKDFFSMYDLEVQIIVNGVNEKRNNTAGSSARFKQLIRENYKEIAHVDNESIISTNRVTKEYETFDIEKNMAWSDGIVDILQNRLNPGDGVSGSFC